MSVNPRKKRKLFLLLFLRLPWFSVSPERPPAVMIFQRRGLKSNRLGKKEKESEDTHSCTDKQTPSNKEREKKGSNEERRGEKGKCHFVV